MKARRARFLEKAQDDLAVVYAFIARDNKKVARTYVKGLRAAMRGHARKGLTGHPREEVRAGLRVLPVDAFEVAPKELIVRRLLHSALDTAGDMFLVTEKRRAGKGATMAAQ